MILSPYTPGSVPLVLAGRDVQLAQIRDQLGGVAVYGQFVGRIRVETGVPWGRQDLTAQGGPGHRGRGRVRDRVGHGPPR